ncbi:methyltransferase domain-containing protein [Nostoc sp. UHCC 0251]|uniref:methyltransferase domain-containing protein n=1 Tax=Nostoc sp. UHCC 0251 TaxID=3110240 RepID=UPI002B1F8D12|nr:methyltransferase domain-containing protein [Nostoc sp. UHCC 0251]MEA5624052.1 methyltransferase domain-containing protein [Nostoc sp. UHCC 0251]
MKSEQISAIEVASGNLVPMSCKPPVLSSTNHWNGIVLEQHHLPAFECPKLCLQQHSINIWLANSCQIDWRLAGGRLQSTQMRRGLVNVTPKGIPTQARWNQEIKFLLVSFDSSLFKKVADDVIIGSYRNIEIILQRGVCDRQILHLGMALKTELQAGCPSGKLYGESVAIALAAHLLKTYSGKRQLNSEFEVNLSIDFNDESFDVILCSTAIVYFKDIPAALRKWYRFLKPGGILGFSCCSEESCGAPLIIEICEKHGISLTSINEPTGSPEKCHHLLTEAGFKNIEVKTQQLGFYNNLEQAKEWNGGWFHPRENPLLQVSSEQMAELKADYRQKIEAEATEEGAWYENLTFFVTGRKL